MEPDADLEAFRSAWERDRDGLAGRRYAEALADASRTDDALAVCERMWEDGYVAGRTDAAWLEHDRGHVEAAIALMSSAVDALDDDDRPLALGILGHWRWHHFNDEAAEPLLRAGMDAYPTARADLSTLLVVTGRRADGVRLLADGVAAGEVVCMLPLANLLDEDGDVAGAIALYERAFAEGDGFAAWNLSLLLEEQGRTDEAAEWRWRAAQAGDEIAIRALVEEGDDPAA